MGLWERTRTWADGKAITRLRERRYELFMELCNVSPTEPILDVGAGGGEALECFNGSNPIVAVDLAPRSDMKWLQRENVSVRVADGTALPFADNEFPVVFSNSVIEHIPKELQPAFAQEVRRVGRRYFIQTPNRMFPIEPHYQFPFFQFLPRGVQRWLNRHFTIGWRRRGNWEDIELLTARRLRKLFPEAEIRRERVFGLTKSLMAVKR
jgi:ubiquinone/menaquinone biosynthesis C-methylase UbiE